MRLIDLYRRWRLKRKMKRLAIKAALQERILRLLCYLVENWIAVQRELRPDPPKKKRFVKIKKRQ